MTEPISLPIGSPDELKGEVILTTDPVLNFCQLAVLTCQRAQGDRSKPIRDSWVRLCGTYQSKGGVLASPEVRAVRFSMRDHCSFETHIWYPARHCKSYLSYISPSPRHVIRPRIHLGTCYLRYLGVHKLAGGVQGLLPNVY